MKVHIAQAFSAEALRVHAPIRSPSLVVERVSMHTAVYMHTVME